MSDATEYIFDNTRETERTRLQAVEAEQDPGTIRHLERFVSPGMHCLEVAGGAGSITRWLCQRVGTSGLVVATDLEPGFLLELQEDNLEVMQHDITRKALPAGRFDVAHTRWLLHHLSEPRKALQSIFNALKPGGWLVVEEVDVGNVQPDLSAPVEIQELFARLRNALVTLLAARGGNYHYGRQLLRDVRGCGFEDVNGEGRSAIGFSGSPSADIWRMSLQAIRDPALAMELLTEPELETLLALPDDPQLTWWPHTTMAVWGRRPA